MEKEEGKCKRKNRSKSLLRGGIETSNVSEFSFSDLDKSYVYRPKSYTSPIRSRNLRLSKIHALLLLKLI